MSRADQAAVLPREAAGALPAEELEGVPWVGEAARLAEAGASAARALPHRLRAVRGILDAGMLSLTLYYVL